MELSENIYGNVYKGDPSQRSLDEDEYDYETIRTESTERKKGNREPPGAGTTKVKSYRVPVVSLGLLCVLLLIVIIRMATKHTAETQQLQRHLDLLQVTNNLTQERDQLQLVNSYLIKERNLFQDRNTNLTKERNQLEITERQVGQENHQLRDINRNLITEKNDLMNKIKNLIDEKEKLINISISQCWRHFNNSFYYISNDRTTWSDGKQQCMDRGGYLVIIDSEEEQVFISKSQGRGWIGLTMVDGTWKWLDGELLKIGYWGKGEPNNGRGNEHCVEIGNRHLPKNWNDLKCTEKRQYICERVVSLN